MATRRTFLQSAAASAAAWSSSALAQSPTTSFPSDQRVYLTGDGIPSTPSEYARLLTKIADKQGTKADQYLAGGAVEQLEHDFAKLLNKEKAVFLPTGTLANHLAVRVLAGEKKRVAVQMESHLYCDESDCAETLSGLKLVPFGVGRAAIPLDELSAVVDRSAGPPFPSPVGAISIESPVRRVDGAVVPFDELKNLCAYARDHRIGTHLDGARMFLASAYTGISPAQYAALFDTVYVSMYKYFNAPFGAILAGPAPSMAHVVELRHQFGSTIFRGWEPAAVALHFHHNFAERYQSAVQNGETVFKLLEASGKFKVERVPNGSNIAKLRMARGTSDVLQLKLATAGIMLRGSKESADFRFQVNETLNRRPPEEVARELINAV